MINMTQLDEVMAAYPDFSYQVRQLEDGVQLRIKRKGADKDGSYRRVIRKVFKENEEEEDLSVLHKILQGKDD